MIPCVAVLLEREGVLAGVPPFYPTSDLLTRNEILSTIGEAAKSAKNVPIFAQYAQMLMQISRYASQDARVVNRLLRTLERVAEIASVEQQRALSFLKVLAQAIAAPALAEAATDFDRALIEDQLTLTLQQMAE